mmetsp:Transcript_1771/g.6981  ORF Transcript_1771/g.6981 Transcript_1771/m.6981 type:complete len:236 (+) Transcript_1771:3010-3717(+)
MRTRGVGLGEDVAGRSACDPGHGGRHCVWHPGVQREVGGGRHRDVQRAGGLTDALLRVRLCPGVVVRKRPQIFVGAAVRRWHGILPSTGRRLGFGPVGGRALNPSRRPTRWRLRRSDTASSAPLRRNVVLDVLGLLRQTPLLLHEAVRHACPEVPVVAGGVQLGHHSLHPSRLVHLGRLGVADRRQRSSRGRRRRRRRAVRRCRARRLKRDGCGGKLADAFAGAPGRVEYLDIGH